MLCTWDRDLSQATNKVKFAGKVGLHGSVPKHKLDGDRCDTLHHFCACLCEDTSACPVAEDLDSHIRHSREDVDQGRIGASLKLSERDPLRPDTQLPQRTLPLPRLL